MFSLFRWFKTIHTLQMSKLAVYELPNEWIASVQTVT